MHIMHNAGERSTANAKAYVSFVVSTRSVHAQGSFEAVCQQQISALHDVGSVAIGCDPAFVKDDSPLAGIEDQVEIVRGD